jgi:molybdopterin molybdotransferase
MITVDQALAQIDSLIPQPLEAESVPIENALNRVLREPATSPEDQPPVDRSSIDGYLVHPDQNKGSVRLLSAYPPGQPAPTLPPLGSAVRILTGSSLPAHAALIMQEDTLLTEPGFIELLKAPTANLVRSKGSHSKKGDTLLSSPHTLQPGSIGLLASIGITQPKVSRLPRVAHLATGAELVDPDKNPALGQIRDSNSILIRSLLASCSTDLVCQKRVGDTRELFTHSVQECLNLSPDIILLSGASSVGDHDYAFSVLQELGFNILFRTVSIRPGKPLILAQKGSTLAFGLPGNPLSHFVCFHLFVRRAILRLLGLTPAPLLSATLLSGAPIKPDPRETWWPCHLHSSQGLLTAQPLPWRDSSDLSCLARTNALLRIHPGCEARSPSEVLPTISW